MRSLVALALLGLMAPLAGCGGGGSSGDVATASAPVPTPAPTPTPTPTPTPPPPLLSNFTSLVVDNGPAALNTGPNAYISSDTAYASVTVCAPGSTTNCQTIDHVAVDTGSVGLRLYAAVLSPSLLSALPVEKAPSGNTVGECYGFVDGYIYGSVRIADMTLGGESAAGLAIQIIADPSLPSPAPASCSKGGGNNINTVQALGANGILGVGVTVTDCGVTCSNGKQGASTYYDCPSTGCSTVIARAANVSAPFQQVANPIAALPIDNNGLIITLPAVAAAGAPTATGTLTFGIGTQSNNSLGGAKVLATTSTSSPSGGGFVTATYRGQTLSDSYLDTGSNAFYFVDSTITACTGTVYKGYYCPATPLSLSASLLAADGSSVAAPFTIVDAKLLYSTNAAALPSLGANPNLLSGLSPYPNSFDFGLPFFFGRTVYVAFEGRSVGATAGPFFAY